MVSLDYLFKSLCKLLQILGLHGKPGCILMSTEILQKITA